MPTVTFADCARCPHHTQCSAHITGGSWKYDKGADPCRFVKEKEEEQDGIWS